MPKTKLATGGQEDGLCLYCQRAFNKGQQMIVLEDGDQLWHVHTHCHNLKTAIAPTEFAPISDDPKPWLWPDHEIGKRESRQLREDHNAVINQLSQLLLLARAREQMIEAFHNAFIDEDRDSLIRRLLSFYRGMPTAQLENLFYQTFPGSFEDPNNTK